MADQKMTDLALLRKHLEAEGGDMARHFVKEFAEQLMGAEADGLCKAGYGQRHPKRANRRNGYREREWDTQSGTIALQLPRLRKGSYFPDWLLEPRRRGEQALRAVVAECYL